MLQNALQINNYGEMKSTDKFKLITITVVKNGESLVYSRFTLSIPIYYTCLYNFYLFKYTNLTLFEEHFKLWKHQFRCLIDIKVIK